MPTANSDIALYVTSEIVKNTDVHKNAVHLARAVLAIPATSAPSERIFSADGVVLKCKRSSLSPNVVDKVIFVHENGHLLEDV